MARTLYGLTFDDVAEADLEGEGFLAGILGAVKGRAKEDGFVAKAMLGETSLRGGGKGKQQGNITNFASNALILWIAISISSDPRPLSARDQTM